MADTKISDLPALTGAVADADVLPVVDASASETKKISAKHLLESSFALVADGSIPGSKVDGDLPAGSIDTSELADKSVTAAKLADDSSGIYGTVPSSGAFRGQIALDSTTKVLSVWSGSAWASAFGVTSFAPTGISPIQVTGSITISGELQVGVGIENSTAAKQFLAGPTGSAGSVSLRGIVGADLPPATSASLGAISAGSGLAVDGAGSLSIDNTVAATTDSHIVSYDANGLVTSGRKILGTDLPIATELNPGVVSAGRGLSVGADGALGITNQITPGTGTKFTCDAQGNITDILVLTGADIPEISADKIVGGSLQPSAIADRSITEIKLADYSTCLVQEGAPSGDFKLGQLWFTPSTSQLRVYGRGSSGDLWLSVGFGALQAQNLRWAGTVNADTSTITTLTDIGVSEGLVAGGPIPTPSDELSGLYFVVDTAGSSITIPNVNGDLCTEGDWILYIDQAQGAIHLDISAGGGGGGGGASKLNDLTDVDLNTVEDQQFLQYDSISGMWKNVSAIDGGTF